MGQKIFRTQPLEEKSQVVRFSQISNSQVTLPFRQSQLNQYLFNTTVSIKNYELEANQYLQALRKISYRIDITNLYLPVGWEFREGEMCEHYKQLNLYYPVFNYQLKNEMEARRFSKQGFSQPQIWYIIISVLNALRQFQKIDRFSTELSIDDIRMNADGLIKIENGFTSIKQYQEIVSIQKHRKSPIQSQIKQTYNLGIIILELCTYLMIPHGGSSSSYNQHYINKSLAVLSQHYSELLSTLVNVMLSSFTDRPLPSQIYEIFSPFKSEIMNFQPFDFSVFNMRNSIAQSKATIPFMLNTNYENNMNNDHRTGEGSMYHPVQSFQGYHQMANQNFNNAYNPSKAPGQDYYMSGHHHQQRLDPQTLQPPVYQGYQGQNSRSSSHYLSPITYQNYPGWQ